MSASPGASARTPRSTKKHTKIVILRLSTNNLSRFVPKKESSSDASTPIKASDDLPSIKRAASHDIMSEANATPGPQPQDAPTPGATSNKKRPANASDTTAAAAAAAAAAKDKVKGKPGPKKKPRLEDGTIDHSVKPAPAPGVNHRLGPKANQGNINANLRALDRTGTPCRRWAKKGFQLRSFTGITWELPTWKGDRAGLQANGGSASDKDVSMHDSSDLKPSESDTAHGSTAGDQVDKMDVSTPAASSPVMTPAAPTIAVQS